MLDNTELYHYGILGMKWGVRKKLERKNGWRERERNKARSMSDSQLNKRVARLQQEQNYLRLVSELDHPKKQRQTQTWISNVLKNAGSQILTGAIAGVGTLALAKVINRAAPKVPGALGQAMAEYQVGGKKKK